MKTGTLECKKKRSKAGKFAYQECKQKGKRLTPVKLENKKQAK